MEKKKIGEILRETQAISEENLQRALEVQRATGERLGGTLLRLQFVDSDILATALGEQYGVEGVNLDAAAPSAEALGLLSYDEALQCGCLPLWCDDESVGIATADPRDQELVERVTRLTGLAAKTFVAPQSAIYRAIKRHYRPEGGLPRAVELRALLTKLKKVIQDIEAVLDG